MNHIKKLQTENEQMREQLKALNENFSAFMIYLSSSKFQGGNDWISATEVFNWVREERMKTIVE